MTHGGPTLAVKLVKRGAEVVGVDIYRTLKPERVAELTRLGVEVYQHPELPGWGGFDLVVAPVHTPPDHPLLREAAWRSTPTATHHQIVGALLKGETAGCKVVEVTGVFGKTTTARLTAHLLSPLGRTLLLDSSGVSLIEGGEVAARSKGSITPAGILEAWDFAEAKGFRPDICVFEVSLGGTGLADVGVVTNIAEDYPIAGGARRAFNGKLQMASLAKPGSLLALNADDGGCKEIGKEAKVEVNWFSLNHGGVQLTLKEAQREGCGAGMKVALSASSLKTVQGCVVEAQIASRLHGKLFGSPNLANTLASATAALSLGEDPSLIERGLPLFEGVEGRMLSQRCEGRLIVDNINPAVNWWVLKGSIEDAAREAEGGRVVLVVGGVIRGACTPADVERMASVLAERRGSISAILYAGELGGMLKRLNPIEGELYGDVEEASREALKLTPEGGVVLRVVRG